MIVYRNEILRKIGKYSCIGWIPMNDIYATEELAVQNCPDNIESSLESIYYRTVKVEVKEN